jgi:hypothetical protein
MKKECIYNLMGVDEFYQDTNSRLRFWYDFIRNNPDVDGDIFEFGVYRGSSLIAAALILKEISSDKKVYGFDSFSGFPSYSQYDELECFYIYKDKYFSDSFLNEYEKFLEVKQITSGQEKFDEISISTSGSFQGTSDLDAFETSKEAILQKIEFFGLDNIILVEGDFKDTVPDFFASHNIKIHSANIDCDLYESYKVVLPFIYNNLISGGYAHLDEYFSFKYPGAKIACDEFFNENNLKPIKNKSREGEFERWYLTKA